MGINGNQGPALVLGPALVIRGRYNILVGSVSSKHGVTQTPLPHHIRVRVEVQLRTHVSIRASFE